jgi:hypothetical protein
MAGTNFIGAKKFQYNFVGWYHLGYFLAIACFVSWHYKWKIWNWQLNYVMTMSLLFPSLSFSCKTSRSHTWSQTIRVVQSCNATQHIERSLYMIFDEFLYALFCARYHKRRSLQSRISRAYFYCSVPCNKYLCFFCCATKEVVFWNMVAYVSSIWKCILHTF